ncbi:Ogt [Symbiodinium sp. KB8]|nr:Ogt [Symbiodinium sp. KB8]
MAEALRSALSSFKHSASNPTELESMLEEIFPGIELTRLQKSRIQAAWANLQTSASSQAQPSSGSSGQLRLEGQEPQTFTQKQLEERAIELENGYCNLGLVLGASATVQLRLEGDEPQEAFVENFNMKGESAVVILFDIQYLPARTAKAAEVFVEASVCPRTPKADVAGTEKDGEPKVPHGEVVAEVSGEVPIEEVKESGFHLHIFNDTPMSMQVLSEASKHLHPAFIPPGGTEKWVPPSGIDLLEAWAHAINSEKLNLVLFKTSYLLELSSGKVYTTLTGGVEKPATDLQGILVSSTVSRIKQIVVTLKRHCERWMWSVPDEVKIEHMTIPGVLDTKQSAQHHNFDFRHMLHTGIRGFDITLSSHLRRLFVDYNSCFGDLEPDNIIDRCMEFLANNSTECIILLVNRSSQADETFNKAFGEFARKTAGRTGVLAKPLPPQALSLKLSDVRGKVVLLRSFYLESPLEDLGAYVTDEIQTLGDSVGARFGHGGPLLKRIPLSQQQAQREAAVNMRMTGRGLSGIIFMQLRPVGEEPDLLCAVGLLLCFNSYLNPGTAMCGCRIGNSGPKIPCAFATRRPKGQTCLRGAACDKCHNCVPRHLGAKRREEERRQAARAVFFQGPPRRLGDVTDPLAPGAVTALAGKRLAFVRAFLPAIMRSDLWPLWQIYQHERGAMRDEICKQLLVMCEPNFSESTKKTKCRQLLEMCREKTCAGDIEETLKPYLATEHGGKSEEHKLTDPEKTFVKLMSCLLCCNLAWPDLKFQDLRVRRQRRQALRMAAAVISHQTLDSFVMSEFWAVTAVCSQEALVGDRQSMRKARDFFGVQDEEILKTWQKQTFTNACKAAEAAGARDLAIEYMHLASWLESTPQYSQQSSGMTTGKRR